MRDGEKKKEEKRKETKSCFGGVAKLGEKSQP